MTDISLVSATQICDVVKLFFGRLVRGRGDQLTTVTGDRRLVLSSPS